MIHNIKANKNPDYCLEQGISHMHGQIRTLQFQRLGITSKSSLLLLRLRLFSGNTYCHF